MPTTTFLRCVSCFGRLWSLRIIESSFPGLIHCWNERRVKMHTQEHTRAHLHTRTRTYSSVHDKHPPSRLPWLVWVPSSLNQSFRKRHLSHHMRYFWTESMRWKVKEKEKWERKHFSFYSHSNIKQWETIFISLKLQWLLSTRNFYCDF